MKRWVICIDGKVDCSFGENKSEAIETYHWMDSAEGRHECDLFHHNEITIHEFDDRLTNRQIEDRIRSQKAFSEMLKNGLAE